MNFDRALEHALNGEAILFTGAGFSIGATNLRRKPFKTGGQLAKHLAELVNFPVDTRLEDASEEYAEQFGEDKLIEELKQEFTAFQISAHHKYLSAIPWKRIYTTNYDNILETASPSLVAVTLTDGADEISKSDRMSVHLNGYIGRLTRKTIWSELKLTDTSYVTASVAESPWAAFFRHDLAIARVVFFVGFSLSDLDIKRILFEDPDLRQKAFFIIGRQPDAATKRRAERYGHVLQLNADEFASKLEEKDRVFERPQLVAPPFYCIEQFVPSISPVSPSDNDVFNLLLFGDVKPELLASSLFRGDSYYLERAEISILMRYIEQGSKAVVIHSDLGNGKTLFLEGVKNRVIERGYHVYSLIAQSFDILFELEAIASPDTRTVLIIESYPDWLDEIKFLSTHSNRNLTLILTARTSPHDILIDRLLDNLDAEYVQEISLDRLNSAEISKIVEFLDLYGLWGERSSWSVERKQIFLARDCHSQFYAILLLILEAPQIVSRFETIMNQLDEQRDFYEVVIVVLALTVLDYHLNINSLVDICGNQILTSQFRRNQTIQLLFDFEGGRIRFRSSVAATFILQRIGNPAVTVAVLVQMARHADKNKGLPMYHELFKGLMRFSRVQQLLPEKGRRASVINYYEQVKNISGARKNPLFWLQYAIASLSLSELQRAEKYFDTAYSLAKARGYNTFQIDNHYARFLLIRAIQTGDSGSCMAEFRGARKIINRQIKQERLHYPYRVASLYEQFYDAFSSHLTVKNREEIGLAAKFVATQIEKLPGSRQQQKSVEQCAEAMDLIIYRVEEDNLQESASE